MTETGADKDSLNIKMERSVTFNVDEIMQDKEKLKKIQTILDEQNKKNDRLVRIEKTKAMIDEIHSLHQEGQRRHEQLKRLIKYKSSNEAMVDRLHKLDREKKEKAEFERMMRERKMKKLARQNSDVQISEHAPEPSKVKLKEEIDI